MTERPPDIPVSALLRLLPAGAVWPSCRLRRHPDHITRATRPCVALYTASSRSRAGPCLTIHDQISSGEDKRRYIIRPNPRPTYTPRPAYP